MDQMIINAELTHDDWLAYQRAAQARVASDSRMGPAWLPVLAYLLMGFVLLWTFDWFDIAFSLPSFITGVVLLVVISLLIRRRTLKLYAPLDHGAFIGPCTFTLSASGLLTQRSSMGSHASWRDVLAITQDEQHLYFWIDTNAAFVLPTRYLPQEVSAASLLTKLEQWRSSATNTAAVTIEPTPPSATATSSHWFKTLLRLLLLRPTPTDAIPHSATAISSTALFSLLVVLGFDRVRAGADPEFFANNVPVLGWYALFVMVVAWVLSRYAAPQIRFGKVLFVLCGGLPLVIALTQSIPSLASKTGLQHPWPLIGYSAIGLYCLAYLGNALRQLSQVRQPRAVLAAVVLALLFAAADSANFWTAQLWYPQEDESVATAEDRTWNDSESLLFEQQQRLDRALNSIAATTPGQTATYFLGFAGVAEQKVFAEEIRLAATVVDDLYDTDKRSLRLVNDRRDLNSQPLATVSNLHYALRGLASKMNIEQDILFLALSSHGSDDPSLQVSNGYLSLQQVTGENLAKALRESGIKWRVIVISACHAGSFIDSLKDPHTIIITAAAADKTSFGCDDERDLTYFGEAFYRDALPTAASLQDAFAQAKAAIAEREQRENIKASDPQAYFGAEISKKLQPQI